MSKVLQERRSGGLLSSTEINPTNHVKLITTTKEAETPSISHIEPHQYVVSSFKKDDKMPLIELSRATILFPSRLKESGYDEKEVLNELTHMYVYMYNSGEAGMLCLDSPSEPVKVFV
ncbi:hypothetical protein Tco_1147855 [Tanacetum coccineum]